MSARLWHFEALDTWFFRESRPHGAVGGSELASLFPPPARTVAGAVRTLIGDASGMDMDWRGFTTKPDYAELRALIGVGDDLGRLALRGPFLMKDGARLYAAPLHVLEKRGEEGKPSTFVRLRPGSPVECDLGIVCLPEMITPTPGARPLEQVWLTADDLAAVLGGGEPTALLRADDLFVEEPRLGIGRINALGVVDKDKGLLYQTRHIRLKEGVAVGVGVSGPEDPPASGVLRFGGEGRPAAVTIAGEYPSLPMPPITGERLLLVLLTHADFGGDWLPPGFTRSHENGVDVWRGNLDGIVLTIHAACAGKPVREGGWDMVIGRPRAVTGLVPAGSVYFCTVEGDPKTAAARLRGSHIGRDAQLGRGELAVGIWGDKT